VSEAFNALERLSAEAMVIRQRASLPPVNPDKECHVLQVLLGRLRDKRSVLPNLRTKLSAKSVWAMFATAGYDINALNALQIRTLCSDEETALRPEFVAGLLTHPELLQRKRCLYGLVNAYFASWRSMSNPDAVERLLLSAFSSQGHNSPVIQRWLANPRLFSDAAARLLAEKVCTERRSVDEVLREVYVGSTTKLGLVARALAAGRAVEALRQMEAGKSSEWSLQYLQWITEKVLSELTLPDAFYGAIGSLILSDSAKRSEVFQRAVRVYVQNNKRLGDPRVRQSSLNWRSVAPQAAQRYLSWLARDNIIFFFNTILPRNSENQRRKDFWLRYHDRIIDFQVAVSEGDLWKVKASQQNSEVLYYSQVAHQTTSAFLMKFESYNGPVLVVEFSETGNAAYIFRFSDFEAQGVTLRTPRFDVKRHLKFNMTHRVLHMSDWESKAAYRLASEFGIRP
jgi:hypothetical protein